MKKRKLVNNPTRVADLSFDDMYDEIAEGWREKSARMQARRWRKLRDQLI